MWFKMQACVLMQSMFVNHTLFSAFSMTTFTPTHWKKCHYPNQAHKVMCQSTLVVDRAPPATQPSPTAATSHGGCTHANHLRKVCCFNHVFLFPVLLIFECMIVPFIGIEDLSGRIPLYYFVEQLFEGSSIVLTGRCIVHTCSFLCKHSKLLLLLNTQSYYTIPVQVH